MHSGDFNTDLDSIKCATPAHLLGILAEFRLHTFDGITVKQATYVNGALNRSSTLDYFVPSDTSMVIDYSVINPDIRYSDHLPVAWVCRIDVACCTVVSENGT